MYMYVIMFPDNKDTSHTKLTPIGSGKHSHSCIHC